MVLNNAEQERRLITILFFGSVKLSSDFVAVKNRRIEDFESTNGENAKYIPLVIMTMLTVAVIIVVGLSELVLAIIPCNVGILIAVLTFEKRIRTIMRRKESKILVKHESPLNWLKGATMFSFFQAHQLFWNFLSIQICLC